MQKKLLGIAVAAALAPAAAFAQPAGTGVQLYGVFDIQAMHNDYDGPADADVAKGAMHSSASRFGIRGREALGAGLNAWFQAEAGVQLDGRPSVDALPNGVGWFGGRDTGVGLDGGWGTVMLGIWGTPYKVANLATWNLGTYGIVSHYGVIMNEDTTGTEPSPFCTPTGATACDGVLVEGGATGFGRRASNTLQYWTPNIGGFQGRIATAFFNSLKTTDGAAVDHDPQLWSLSLMWSGGPFTVGGAYEQHKGFRASGVPGTDNDATDTGWFIGGKWTGGPFAIGGAYESREFDDTGIGNGFEITSWVINGTFNMGNGQVFAGYSQQENEDCGPGFGTAAPCADGGKANMITAGYAHNLSKRTKAYVNFGRIDNDTNLARYYIAGPSGNAGSGATGSIVGGTKVTTFGVGVQHSF